MMINFSEFVEFQNTKASKKALAKEASEGLPLRFAKVKSGKKEYVAATLSTALIECMKKNRLTTFKMLFNQKTSEIIFQYDGTSSAIDLDSYKIQPQGISVINKFISYTMLPLIPNGKSSLKYSCEFNDSLRMILCTPKKD